MHTAVLDQNASAKNEQSNIAALLAGLEEGSRKVERGGEGRRQCYKCCIILHRCALRAFWQPGGCVSACAGVCGITDLLQ